MTNEIYKWLIELDKLETAKFFKENCTINSNYVDVSWDSDDRETVIISIDIAVPLKKYKELQLYQQYTAEIEECIFDYNQANGMYANSIRWNPVLISSNNDHIQSAHDLKETMTEEYIIGQIEIMNESFKKTPHLSIGIAKELIETFCKSVLKKFSVEYDKDWDTPKLMKEANKILFSFIADDAEEKKSLLKMISGVTTIVQGITELRNSYGSGHGREENFKQLDLPYVRFIIATTSEIILLWKTLYNKREL